MKTSAARRPEAFLTNCRAFSTLPLNFSHFRFGLTVQQSDGASKHTFCPDSQEDGVVQSTIQASTAVEIVFKWTASSVLPLEPFLQSFSFQRF